MLILYKDDRNVRFVLFTKTSKQRSSGKIQFYLVPGSILYLYHCIALDTWVFIHFITLYSVKHISGNTFALIASTMVIFLLAAQYTVLSSVLPGNRNWIEVVGVIFVLGGSTLVSIIELCKRSK